LTTAPIGSRANSWYGVLSTSPRTNSTFRKSRMPAYARACMSFVRSRSTPTTRAPACAATNASRPSPVPTSNTSFPRKSSCRNCSISIGRRASDSFAASLHGRVRLWRPPSARGAAGSPDDVNAAVEAGRAGFHSPDWWDLDPSKRGRLLWVLGQQVRDHFEALARLESQNVGKPLREAKGDIAYVYKSFE